MRVAEGRGRRAERCAGAVEDMAFTSDPRRPRVQLALSLARVIRAVLKSVDEFRLFFSVFSFPYVRFLPDNLRVLSQSGLKSSALV